MQTVACPPSEQLKAYLSGKLDESTSDLMTHHLHECEDCQRTAVRFELEPDTLVGLLQDDTIQSAPSVHAASAELASARATAEASSTGQDLAGSLDVLRVPPVLGQYELRTRLGTGGMGAVYLGRHKSLDKQVAIKLLPALPAQNAEFVARFQREMRAAGKLEHAAIVRTTDAGEQLGIHFLVMEAIDGMDLGRLVRIEEKLSIADACEMVRQAAVGLAHAHEKGIVHRDVKPSNLMLDASGHIRILDFGLAQIGCWESGSAEITTVGQLMGTLDYMAPEQAERGGAVDYRADLYSLGATLFRLLTGRAPLAAAPNLTPLEKLRLLATHRPPKLRSLRPDAPESLSQIVDAMLASEPSQRPASAIHAAELLEPFSAGSDLSGLLERARSKPPVDESSFVLNPLLQRDLVHAPAPSDTSSAAAVQRQPKTHDSGSKKLTGRPFWLALAGFGAMLFGGILLVLETSKGQLVIDSEADVQVKLVAVDDEGKRSDVDELKIEPGTKSTRLKSGKYEITLDSPSDAFGVTNGSFTIRRGETVVATISHKAASNGEVKVATADESPAAEDPRLNQVVFDNETLDTWLRHLEFERNPVEVTRTLLAVKELASEELRDVIQTPLVRFAQRTQNNEHLDLAILALTQCCGDAFHEAIAQILAGTDDELLRVAILQKSIIHIVRTGASTLDVDSLFMAEVQKLLDSESPSISLETALLVRGMTCTLPNGDFSPQVQRQLLRKFEDTPALTNENFWLAYPGVMYPLRFGSISASGGTATTVLEGGLLILDEIMDRAMAALVDTTTPLKVQTQAKIVLRSLLEEGVELATSQLEPLVDFVARDLKQASGDLRICTVEVALSSRFSPYVAPRMPADTFDFVAGDPISVANAMIQTLNLASAADVQDDVSNELQTLFDGLHDSPLHSEYLARDLRQRNGWEWNKFVARYREVGSVWNQLIYLQAGTMLNKPINELLARTATQLPADLARSIELNLDAIERGPDRPASSLSTLYELPIESYPRALVVLEKLFTTREFVNNLGGQPPGELPVLMKAAGDDFPASYARVLENTAGANRLRLLNVDLTAFPDFQCTKPDALRLLLDWCDQTVQADPEQEYRAAITGMLSHLVTDKPCNSLECQQMVVDQLERFEFLTDSDSWLAQPISGSDWGPPMRQAVVKRAFAMIAKEEATDGALLCKALAILRDATLVDGEAAWETVPTELQQAAFEQMDKRLAAAVEEPSSEAEVYSLPPQFGGLVFPIFVDKQLTSASSVVSTFANPEILILNLLTTSLKSNAEQLDRLRPTVRSLHERLEQLNLMKQQLSSWNATWTTIVGRSRDQQELILHTWYMQTGGLLGLDVETLRDRPAKLAQEDRLRKQRFVQPRDTLAIHIPNVLPQSGDPPVLQAGTSTPVVGFPVPVSPDGTIQLPMLDPIKVADLELSQVQAEIKRQYVDNKILLADMSRDITVQFLLRAGQGTEVRNIAGSSAVSVPEK